MAHRVAYRPTARLDLKEIYDWIAERADPATADAYVQRLQDACARLSVFPARGSPRDELEPGLRSIPLSGRATAYYRVEGRIVIRRGNSARFDAYSSPMRRAAMKAS